MAAERGQDLAGQPRRVSLWALLSLLCGVAVFCPVTSVLGPLLGLVALAEIRRKPQRTGRRLAVAGITIGLLATAGWAATARWWHVNARVPMLRGPVEALAAGLGGDVAGFRVGFAGGGAADDGAQAFLEEVGGRYGRLVGSAQRPSSQETDPAPADMSRPRIVYLFEFESGPVETEAQFVVWEPGQGLVLKFAWLAFRDQESGDLVYPASAADVVGYDPESQPEQPR
ncbi:MAG: DUF4190 domain-containing protein [Planctomycetota bacterium]|jgi:hypothetical protein